MSNVATFDAAWDAFGKELESEGDEGCVLAAEDSGTLEVGEGLGEEILVEVVFGHLVDLALDCTYAGLDMGNDRLSVADDGLGTAEASGKGELLGGEFFLENIKGVVVRAGEAVDGLVAVADCDEAAILNRVYHVWNFDHPPSNFTTSGIGILCFINEHKIKLRELEIMFQRHPDHI